MPVDGDYGKHCFTDTVMAGYVDEAVLEELKGVRKGNLKLTAELADTISAAMKEWAVANGAMHFTHWFQPLTNHTAGKQDSLIKPCGKGKVIYELSASELLSGESDASSFPTGGLRSTFEARGKMEWDTQSPVFIKESLDTKILYIPTKFLSFNGEALDMKTPLLRSVNSVSDNVSSLLSVVEDNHEYGRIKVCLGPEQEYFLVDRKYFERRPDLRITGRTILGAVTAAGFYSDEHYFAGFSERVQLFLQELNRKLWDVGIAPCTEHQEAAPNQFEIVLHYGTCNIIADQNLMMNEIMQETAGHYDLVVLFDEKPYNGVNGSGKHTNWSLENKRGENLFSPGRNGEWTMRFLLMLAVFVKAVDENSDLLRCSAASYSNDLRLSEGEAPPTIMSLYLGEKLSSILSASPEEILKTKLVSTDAINTDRNRTSPIAFTGNKFELRFTGASQSVSGPATFINALFSKACADVLAVIGNSKPDDRKLAELISALYREHGRIVYNDNCYSGMWQYESRRRGLENIENTPLALEVLMRKKNVGMLGKLGIFTKAELESRRNIFLSSYVKRFKLEAFIMVQMVKRGIVPVVRDELLKYNECSRYNESLKIYAEKVGSVFSSVLGSLKKLEDGMEECKDMDELSTEDALEIKKKLSAGMCELRKWTDKLESYIDEDKWPYPSYDKLFFKL